MLIMHMQSEQVIIHSISCAIDATFPFLPHLTLTVTEEKH